MVDSRTSTAFVWVQWINGGWEGQSIVDGDVDLWCESIFVDPVPKLSRELIEGRVIHRGEECACLCPCAVMMSKALGLLSKT